MQDFAKSLRKSLIRTKKFAKYEGKFSRNFTMSCENFRFLESLATAIVMENSSHGYNRCIIYKDLHSLVLASLDYPV